MRDQDFEVTLDDWRNAGFRPALHATLAYLEKLTLHPASLGPADVAAARAAGVSYEALEDAIHVCALFNLMNRVADALGFELLGAASDRRVAHFLEWIGYRL